MTPDDVKDIRDRLARIETKLDVVQDHETRLRSQEKRSWIAMGMAIVLPLLGIKYGVGA